MPENLELKPGVEAPWLSPYGACLIEVYDVRLKDDSVEFGIGNETLPILKYVKKNAFYNEWPD